MTRTKGNCIIADASKVSGAEFFETVFGKRLPTKAEREAQWRADCEHYADLIEAGGGWGIPPPYRAAAEAIVEERKLTRQVDRELRRTIEIQRRVA